MNFTTKDYGQPQGRSSVPGSRRRWLVGVLIAVAVFILGVVSFGVWYQRQLQPVDTQADDAWYQRVTVTDGMTVKELATVLQDKGIIRNAVAFEMYARLSGKTGQLEAGSCEVSTRQSVKELLDAFTGGCEQADYLSITFYPGATIEKPLFKSAHADDIDQDQMYIKGVLSRAGFADDEITAALSAHYEGPLFADKPAGTSLEGYIFGETYYVDPSASAQTVLQTTFDEMYQQLQQYDIVAGFEKQGLNLYEGITLASIVQRELNCEGKTTDTARNECYVALQGVARVFLNRLEQGISLGSDVTFIYAADQLGITPTVDIDSPYNTRVHTGLPPGPIASPGVLAMRAVADPADSSNLFFIAGDDGNIYFATDEAGHQANIEKYCQILCSEL